MDNFEINLSNNGRHGTITVGGKKIDGVRAINFSTSVDEVAQLTLEIVPENIRINSDGNVVIGEQKPVVKATDPSNGPKYKIGDRVQVNGSRNDRHVGQYGNVNELCRVPYVILDGGEKVAFVEDELDLVVAPKTKVGINDVIFSKGDRVKVNTSNLSEYTGSYGNVQEISRVPYVKFDNGETWAFLQSDLDLVVEPKEEKSIAKVGDTIKIVNPDMYSKAKGRSNTTHVVTEVNPRNVFTVAHEVFNHEEYEIIEPKKTEYTLSHIYKVGDKVIMIEDDMFKKGEICEVMVEDLSRMPRLKSLTNFASYWIERTSFKPYVEIIEPKIVTKLAKRKAKIGETIRITRPDAISRFKNRGHKDYKVTSVLIGGVSASGNGEEDHPFCHSEYDVVVTITEPTIHKWTQYEKDRANTISKCIICDLYEENLSPTIYVTPLSVTVKLCFGLPAESRQATSNVNPKFDEPCIEIGKCVALCKLVGKEIPNFITHATAN
jgi:hypothetical protein